MSYFADMAASFDAGDCPSLPANSSRQDDNETSSPSNEEVPGRRELSMSESMHVLSDTRHELSKISTLLSPGLKLPQLSPDTTERVFPIRSVVSLDSSAPSSAPQSPSAEKAGSPFSPFEEKFWGSPTTDDRAWGTTSPLEGANTASLSQGPNIVLEKWRQTDDVKPELPIFTRRTSKYGLYLSGITPVGALSDQESTSGKSPGDALGLPIQLQATVSEGGQSLVTYEGTDELQDSPKESSRDFETIQSFGVLIVLQESEGKLAVRIVSKNSKDIIGYAPRELFRLDSLCDILPEQQKDDFLDHVRYIKDEEYDIEQNGPDILYLSITRPDGTERDFWCTIHATNEAIICELEPEESPSSRLAPSGDAICDEVTVGNLDGKAAYTKKTLERFRQNQKRFGFTTKAFNSISQIMQMTATAQSVEKLLDRVVDIVKQLTGFGRIVIHQFDGDWNSVVVAESVDSKIDKSIGSYKGVHFPASVFPEELRSVHSRNKVHVSYGQNSPQADLAYRISGDRKAPLDMTYAYLPAAPPVAKYSAEMTTYTSMTISINVFGKLWGLILCQSYQKHLRLTPPVRKVCWPISDMVSRNIERLACTSSIQMRNLTDHSTETDSTRSVVTSCGGDILGLFEADHAASSISGETKILGKPSDSQEVLALVEYLRMRQVDTVLWSIDIGKDFQDLSYPPGFKLIAGLLYIPLSAAGQDFIVFFRNRQWKEITWVVSPLKEEQKDDSSRSSVNVRKETVLCRPDGWLAVDLENASILSRVYRSFTEIWQQKEAVMQGTQLMKLLLANCAHEFRTPLNAIINYLEIALDGSLNKETRENLSRSHSASKSLIYIINDLLDLTNAENGQSLIKDEVFNLSETIREATDIFGEEAKQKHVDLLIVQHSKLPPVLGDQRRVRQVIMNLISNAVQHTSSGAVTVETYILPDQGETDNIAVEVAIHDTGSGMSQKTVEALFCELEQVSNKDYIQNSQSCRNKIASGTEESRNVLGLGLALVARIVRNMNGQLSLKSEEGKGSCFKIRLRFPLPVDETQCLSAQASSLPEVIPISEAAQDSQDKALTDGVDEEGQGRINMCEKDTGNGGDQTQPALHDGKGDFTSSLTADKKRFTLETVTPQSAHLSEIGGPDGTKESMPQISSSASQEQKDNSGTLQDSPHTGVADSKEGTSTERPSTTTTQVKSDSTTQELEVKPAEASEGAANPPAAPKPPITRTNSNLHVLVAEDDPVNSTILRKRLEKFGHTVHMTGNGKECASVYRENSQSFDAVLMDIQVRRPVLDFLATPPPEKKERINKIKDLRKLLTRKRCPLSTA